MDYLKENIRKPNPREKANIISNFLFCYTSPIFRKGLTTDIQEDDVYEVLPKLKSSRLGDQLKKEWVKSKYRNNPSIFLLLWICYRFECAFLILAFTLCLIVRAWISPVLIGMIVSYYAPDQNTVTKRDAVLYCCILIIINFINSACFQNIDIATQVLGIKLRASLSSFIYENALNLKPSQLKQESIGKITTMITQDVAEIESASVLFVKLIPGFLNTVIVLGLFYKRIGLPSVVVSLSFLALLPIQVLFARWAVKLGVGKLQKIDERIQLTKNTLSALKTIKMYVWEIFFLKKIAYTRKNEVSNINRIFLVHFILRGMAEIVYYLSLFALILLYVRSEETITAGNIFFIVSSIQAISMSLILDIPIVLHVGALGLSALHRIQAVLKEIDSEFTIQNQDTFKKESASGSIKLENVTVIIRDRTVLTNVSLNIDRGLTVLTGSTGSGKTMFLKTVLGENDICDGRLTIGGRISYASQEPWLFPATIRQNIIFSEEFDQGRYKQVLATCALLEDFQSFEAGDLTIVADSAINLSKGQQSRINLARAVYRKADIYLIDDCLSCLDTIVADSVFRKCIVNFLNEQLVVFVTHRLDFLKYADMKFDFDKGRVVSVEKIEAIKGNQEFKENFEIIDDNVIEDNFDTDSENDMNKLLNYSSHLKNVYKDNQQFTKVSCTPYLKYLRFGVRAYLLWLMAGVFIITQGAINYKDTLISKWADLEENISKQRFNTTNDNSTSSFELLIEERHITFCLYFFLIMIVALGTFGAGAFLFNLAKIVSINFHKCLMVKLVNAQMIFFTNNFMGNTLNRLYQDIAVLDHRLPLVFYIFIYTFLSFIGSFVMVVSVNYIFVLPMTIFIMILLLLRWNFIRTGRSLRRLNMSMSSAMIGHATSSLEGLTTVRVFGAKHILIKEFDKHQDLYISVSYMNLSCLTAFSFVGELLCVALVACVLIKFLCADDTSAGNIGLALSQSVTLIYKADFVVKHWLCIETFITSIERLLEYTEIQQEHKPGLELKEWPKDGQIRYDNVNLFYDANSKVSVLKMLNWSINPKQKIGIVGRTGSGKSSIISILFRLFNYEGTIFVDGVDIKTLTLKILRSNISILPQDPLIFTGSIRDNIDPLKKYTDEEIWKVLGITNLKSIISDLDFQITPDINLSVGQKQLLSLTRVLLQKNKIIIFDEASENMDSETDTVVKKIIHENFNFYTLIAIAHKLDFVMDCDKVILMDKGTIVQYGSPRVLMKDRHGLFFKMVKKSNIVVYE